MHVLTRVNGCGRSYGSSRGITGTITPVHTIGITMARRAGAGRSRSRRRTERDERADRALIPRDSLADSLISGVWISDAFQDRELADERADVVQILGGDVGVAGDELGGEVAGFGRDF